MNMNLPGIVKNRANKPIVELDTFKLLVRNLDDFARWIPANHRYDAMLNSWGYRFIPCVR